jgi:hypothetical protein
MDHHHHPQNRSGGGSGSGGGGSKLESWGATLGAGSRGVMRAAAGGEGMVQFDAGIKKGFHVNREFRCCTVVNSSVGTSLGVVNF